MVHFPAGSPWGRRWGAVTSGHIVDIWGSSSNNVYAVGNEEEVGVILRYDGVSWRKVYSGEGEYFESVSGSGPDTVYAGGSKTRPG